ncbi:MAG TPA: hypothetical protein PLN52_19165 [Opitutaceae bacterium]|nr:hypothetical protein [Opitutaceae bacterium]
MNRDAPLFYIIYLIALIWLGLLYAVSGRRRGRRPVSVLQKWGLGLVAAGSVFVLVKGLPLWTMVFSFYPNPSLPLMCLVMIALWKQLTGHTLFRAEEWRAAWIFGAVAGTTLYLHSFLYGPVDLYFFGWDSEPVVACTVGFGLVFLANGNRFGILFIVALLAFGIDTLESANGWDYLIDPAYWMVGLGITATKGTGWLLRRWRSRNKESGSLSLESNPSVEL